MGDGSGGIGVPPQLVEFVERRKAQGADSATIRRELYATGWSAAQVEALMGAAPAEEAPPKAMPRYEGPPSAQPQPVPQPAWEHETPQVDPARIALGVLGGIVGAVVAGLLWGFFTTRFALIWGIMPLAVGVLCGFGVRLGARSKGIVYQIIGVAAGVLGLAIGRVAAWQFVQPDAPGGLLGHISRLPSHIVPLDGLWVLIAAMGAWYVLQPGTYLSRDARRRT